jgi:hypothetical protein
MTLKNAIEMIRNLRNCEVEAVRIFNDDPYDNKYAIVRIRKSMANVSQGKVDYLAKILSELQTIKMKRLPKKCNHPKKDHNMTSDGQRYCMNCNANL